jgi:hypothetical protein
MVTQVINSFTQYELTEDEMDEAVLLSPLLRMYLQTRMAILAQEKLNAKFDANNPVRFAQLEAELTGKISIIDELLEASSLVYERKKQELQSSTTQDESSFQ